MEVRSSRDDIIIVDAGSGMRRLGNRMLAEGRFEYTLLFTHLHWDHVQGLPFFKPVYSPKTKMAIYGCPFGMGTMASLLEGVMCAPYFPVPYKALLSSLTHVDACDLDIRISDMRITSIPVNHPNKGLGYRFEEKGRSFVFLTDNELDFAHDGGLAFDDYVEFARGADLLVHDAEYSLEQYEALTRGWGHSVYHHALDLAIRAGVKRFGLFHINQERSDDAVDELVADCRRILDEKGVDMECFAMAQDMEITL
ncbi:ribonuclease BN (tRNA processing enzyme) [Desulfobaculum xiamenense]|uniref:Ribonuclease BN (tRNA processing enzyme) n=1 Tax=Desulfobaculum xiamenense TaxID=995050 RepID=A0A846QMI6_9BACT|nr:ribonuclease BN (tRNA processing enzyme) [Desulfobaculum xiamenense]